MKTPDWTEFKASDGAEPEGACCLLEASFPLDELPKNYIWTLGYLGVFLGAEDAEVSAQVKSYSREWLRERADMLRQKQEQAAEKQAQLEALASERQRQTQAANEAGNFSDMDAINRRIEAGPLKMAASLIKTAGQLVTGGTTDPAERMAICAKCPFMGDDKRCGKCGCFLPAKTRVAKATCPLAKW